MLSETIQRPLSFDEAMSEKAVWIEDDGCETGNELFPALYAGKGQQDHSVFDYERGNMLTDHAWYRNEEYGETWRCWAKRPTSEERTAAKWRK